MTDLTPHNLEQAGFRLIEWNRGIILEYWKSFCNDDQEHRVGVRFGEYKDIPFIVWLIFPNYMYALRHITALEEVELLLELMGA